MRGGGIQESKMAYHSGGSSGDLTSGDEIDQHVHIGKWREFMAITC